ncbi:hypothetical protein [Streptomyces sp. NPDC000880]
MGHLLLDMLDDVRRVPDGHCTWRFRRHLAEDGAHQLIFGAATRYDPEIQAAFSAYVQLRHHEVGARTSRAEESSTLCVLLTPRHDGHRPWDTTMVRTHGPSQLTEGELRAFDQVWNRSGEPDPVTELELHADVGRVRPRWWTGRSQGSAKPDHGTPAFQQA